ncbi:MAG: peptide deformylase [Ignavibacterium album]|jgi:peptide deformylase|uniref:peptide deformylase n=1 Tax=Ignavibacterium album TaxID=591197 RepID=UPI0026EBB77E|nr:peptide deformylase [Ignavibacterium album]MBI5663300.1 peptide deformylase [Ignavibacterium album]
MSVLPITVCGDKILRKKAAKVIEIDDKLINIIANMFETMRNANGIGLAANQIGVNRQIFVVDISPVEGYEKYKPLAMINPKIISRSDETSSFEEGCLSIPDLRADIIRPKGIQISYFDTNMKEHLIEADDLLARVIQHEFDHLQGILFIDYLDEESKKRYKRHLDKIRKRKLEVQYPISNSSDYLLIK